MRMVCEGGWQAAQRGHRLRAGIGRPADKRVSHALPRLTLGAAREADLAERKNTGLAVPNAKRLNDCYHELSEAIAARPAMNGDRNLWQYDYAALPGGPEGAEREHWNHRCGSHDVALVALRGAVRDGHLQVWTYGPHGEAKVDHQELKELTFRTFKSGTYQPDIGLIDCGLADSPLWVKDADWHRFMLNLWAVRYGIDWANPAPPPDTPRMPPEWQFVTLSHALTWIAFGVSMSSDQLHEVLSQDRYGEHDPQEAIRDAVQRLCDLGSGGRIVLWGKHRKGRHDDGKKLLTAAIEPIRLADFRQFSYLDDELRHGEGLLFWHNATETTLDYIFGDGRNDSYHQVTVNRAELLREFPPKELARIAVTSTAGAENECRDWLAKEFAADPDKARTKADFRIAALAAFPGRLSERGFDLRVWPALAQQHGRDGPGAKKKS